MDINFWPTEDMNEGHAATRLHSGTIQTHTRIHAYKRLHQDFMGVERLGTEGMGTDCSQLWILMAFSVYAYRVRLGALLM